MQPAGLGPGVAAAYTSAAGVDWPVRAQPCRVRRWLGDSEAPRPRPSRHGRTRPGVARGALAEVGAAARALCPESLPVLVRVEVIRARRPAGTLHPARKADDFGPGPMMVRLPRPGRSESSFRTDPCTHDVQSCGSTTTGYGRISPYPGPPGRSRRLHHRRLRADHVRSGVTGRGQRT